jgi:hypothetical protein
VVLLAHGNNILVQLTRNVDRGFVVLTLC